MCKMLPAAAFFILSTIVLAQQAPVQQPIGTVSTREALVTGGLEVRGEQASLLTNASVTAYDRTASLKLARGGEVLVCSTSRFHVLHSGNERSLLFGLDRGALEIHAQALPQDVVLTPDLRFTFVTAGQLDMRLRVTSSGDTCVENAGAGAPVVAVSDAFSDASYRLQQGQHVLFEHGNLHEVVDSERSSCGCPASLPSAQLADGSANPAEARNPFPSAVSQGLAPEETPARNPTPGGEVHVQVKTTLAYSPGGEAAAPTAAPAPVTAASQPATAVAPTPPASPPGAHDIAHAIGRFFHRLFHEKDAAQDHSGQVH